MSKPTLSAVIAAAISLVLWIGICMYFKVGTTTIVIVAPILAVVCFGATHLLTGRVEKARH